MRKSGVVMGFLIVWVACGSVRRGRFSSVAATNLCLAVINALLLPVHTGK